jgi:hypothetical protein
MSYSMTTEQYRNRTKTVTRRQGWDFLQPGEVFMGIEKGMGLKKGEKVVKLGPARVVAIERRLIWDIDQADCIAEGFPHLTPAEFVAMYCKHNRVTPGDTCNRIVFEHLDEGVV